MCLCTRFTDNKMVISREIQDKLAATPQGVVLSVNDFGIAPEYQPALVKALNRMVSNGLLCKVSKGKFYKPKETLFGTLKPSVSEIVKDFLTKDGRTIGYISGTAAFAQMGITTQISSAIIVGTNKYRRLLKRGEYSVSQSIRMIQLRVC